MMDSTAPSVLLIADGGPQGTSLIRAMEAATIAVEWAQSITELRARAARQDLKAPVLVVVDLELPDASVDALITLVLDRFSLAQIVALACDLTGERGARLLSQGVPSLTKPVSPSALAALALRFSLDPRPANSERAVEPPPEPRRHLEVVFSRYSTDRVLSKQQQQILRLYLSGMNDKEIALTCKCSEATVYEHWRRMARKAGGLHKGDAIADFHRFLAVD